MSREPEEKVKIALMNLDQAFALAFSSINKSSSFEEKQALEESMHGLYASFSEVFGKLDNQYNIYGDHEEVIDADISTFYSLMIEKYF